MPRLLKRVLALAAIAAVVAVVAFVTLSPMVQKEAAGRRAKALADAPVPVVDAPARVADVPVYLNGVGTAKARNTVTVRAAGRRPHHEPQVQGRTGRQARRCAGPDRPCHLPGAAGAGDRQEGTRRGAAGQRPARPRALRETDVALRRREDHRHAARPGRPAHGADQAGRRRHRQRQSLPRLHDHRVAARRPHRHPHDRRGQPGARHRRQRRHRDDHGGQAHRRNLHAAATAAGPGQRRVRTGRGDGRGARRRRQDGARPRRLAGRRQPGGPDRPGPCA